MLLFKYILPNEILFCKKLNLKIQTSSNSTTFQPLDFLLNDKQICLCDNNRTIKMFAKRSFNSLLVLRNFSSGKNLIDVAVDNLGIATVTLQNPPVNSLNYPLVSELSNTLISLQKDKSRGLILKSVCVVTCGTYEPGLIRLQFSDKVFSAGIDLLELYKPEEDKVKRYWTALQDCWINLYGFSAPTVACINVSFINFCCLLTYQK